MSSDPCGPSTDAGGDTENDAADHSDCDLSITVTSLSGEWVAQLYYKESTFPESLQDLKIAVRNHSADSWELDVNSMEFVLTHPEAPYASDQSGSEEDDENADRGLEDDDDICSIMLTNTNYAKYRGDAIAKYRETASQRDSALVGSTMYLQILIRPLVTSLPAKWFSHTESFLRAYEAPYGGRTAVRLGMATPEEISAEYEKSKSSEENNIVDIICKILGVSSTPPGDRIQGVLNPFPSTLGKLAELDTEPIQIIPMPPSMSSSSNPVYDTERLKYCAAVLSARFVFPQGTPTSELLPYPDSDSDLYLAGFGSMREFCRHCLSQNILSQLEYQYDQWMIESWNAGTEDIRDNEGNVADGTADLETGPMGENRARRITNTLIDSMPDDVWVVRCWLLPGQVYGSVRSQNKTGADVSQGLLFVLGKNGEGGACCLVVDDDGYRERTDEQAANFRANWIRQNHNPSLSAIHQRAQSRKINIRG